MLHDFYQESESQLSKSHFLEENVTETWEEGELSGLAFGFSLVPFQERNFIPNRCLRNSQGEKCNYSPLGT